MINRRKGTIIGLICAIGMLVFAYLLRRGLPLGDNVLVLTTASILRCAIHMSLLFCWCVSLYRRLVNNQIRRIIMSTGGLMAFWLLAKTVKHEFLVHNTDAVGRYMWYCFYIPMILIPLFGVFIIDHIGKPEGYRSPRWMRYLYIPAITLLLTVFTNDAHQLVFRFYNGFANYDSDYGYGFVYFIIMAWYILLSLYFPVMLVKKCRVPGSNRIQKLPIIIMLFGVAFWVVYTMRLIYVDLTVVDCLIIAGLLESSIQIGMIPSNSNYQEIFNGTTLPIQVVDTDYQPHYVSAGALPVSEEDMRRSADGTVNLGDTLLHSAPITAGRVVWQDDIRVINALRQRLQDTQEQLSEESVILQAEAEVKENRAKTDEQNRLYDRIAREVEPQLKKVDELLGRIDSEPENTRALLTSVCVIGSYIKRRGNLLLLGEENEYINSTELLYCIRETLENLHLGGAYTAINGNCEGRLRAEYVVAVYDFCEEMIERLLDDITAIMVNLTCRDGGIRVNIQMGCREDIVQLFLEDLSFPIGTMTYDIMDEDVVIDLVVNEGGEGK